MATASRVSVQPLCITAAPEPPQSPASGTDDRLRRPICRSAGRPCPKDPPAKLLTNADSDPLHRPLRSHGSFPY